MTPTTMKNQMKNLQAMNPELEQIPAVEIVMSGDAYTALMREIADLRDLKRKYEELHQEMKATRDYITKHL